ncbi:MAG TPA: CYTH domain-containing protein [Sedimenticola sp.]|nr:CYTH domain-containing protein [Sedimenticola sp.]
MANEIERKYLVKNDGWREHVLSRQRMKQGYLASGERATVRVRIAGDRAWLTIKGATRGISRSEFEYPIPVADAEQLLSEMVEQPYIDKTRYRVQEGPHTWEVDVFEGENRGLVLAELELGSEDEPFDLPAWAGEEVSADPRYYNARLARHPYRSWK